MISRINFTYLLFVLFIVSLCLKHIFIILLILCAHYAQPISADSGPFILLFNYGFFFSFMSYFYKVFFSVTVTPYPRLIFFIFFYQFIFLCQCFYTYFITYFFVFTIIVTYSLKVFQFLFHFFCLFIYSRAKITLRAKKSSCISFLIHAFIQNLLL